MLISGRWHICDDGVTRPVVQGEVLTAGGVWAWARFLVDTAADRTVFSADIWTAVGLPPLASAEGISGVGGEAPSVVIETQIRFEQSDGPEVLFRGRFAAVTALESLDMSILGRDVTNLFAVIVDRPGDFVGLLGQRHRYSVQET